MGVYYHYTIARYTLMSGAGIESYRFSTPFSFSPRQRRVKNKKKLFDSQTRAKQFARSPLVQSLRSFSSGCWESNPALLFPKQIYYRYTTPRYNFQNIPQKQISTPDTCPPRAGTTPREIPRQYSTFRSKDNLLTSLPKNDELPMNRAHCSHPPIFPGVTTGISFHP